MWGSPPSEHSLPWETPSITPPPVTQLRLLLEPDVAVSPGPSLLRGQGFPGQPLRDLSYPNYPSQINVEFKASRENGP